MARYYVNRNAQNNGDHEVHQDGCPTPAKPENRLYLGDFDSCFPAVQAAKSYYPQANGCKHCAAPCHTG